MGHRKCTDCGLYLRGQRETTFGIGKFILICANNGAMLLHVVFDPQGRGDEVIRMPSRSLLLDEETVSLNQSKTFSPVEINGFINAEFLLAADLVDKIAHAQTVGIAFQYADKAPTFLGFSGMDFRKGAKMLVGFRKTCH